MSTFIQKGGFTDLVATTRVRLARNVRGYTYRGLGLGEYREIADKVWSALQTAPAIASDFAMTEVRAGSQEAAALVEKHLISPDLARKGGFLIASSDGGAAIMIGEEDHIRLQVLGSGLCPKECMETARRLAGLLEGQLQMDYDEKLGYLTACPSNLGTGLRASVMLHLPVLAANSGLSQMMSWAGRQGFTVRGAYGEGSKATGAFFQLSNQITLGLSEDAIIDRLIDAATGVIEAEKKAREQLRTRDEIGLSDQVCRAAGILRTARRIDTAEALECLSYVLIGLQMGYLRGVPSQDIMAAEQAVRPVLLGGTAGERDVKRATFLRAVTENLEVLD
ncbi:MAG: ATP--guanido phosphotransferase [Clostridiaceae bacterium]|nr:ATP--guanido phosphotransferase [Clostridiaceae bacterium]